MFSMNAKRSRDIDSDESAQQKKSDRRTAFLRNLKALNYSLCDWFKANIDSKGYVDLSLTAQDYKDYISDLEDRYLRNHGEVLTFGSGDCGQLAHGIDSDEDLMVRYPRIVQPLRYKKVVGIACGGLHNAVFTDQGQCFTWGCSDDGSLGREGDESIPLLVSGALEKEVIIGVSCGDGQTIVLSLEGEVWGWGCFKDKEGKKFFNPEKSSTNPVKEIKNQRQFPIKISPLLNIVEISSGSSFCLARDSSGFVYSWGISECGEIGREAPTLKKKVKLPDGEDDMVYDLDNILKYHLTPGKMQKKLNKTPSTIPIDNVKSIGSGSYHSFAVVVGNTVFSCGLNNYAQLGLGDTETRQYLEQVTSLDDKDIVSVKGGIHHSVALSNQGQLYSFGRGDSGQLGVTDMVGKAAGVFSETPCNITVPFTDAKEKVASIACGGNHNLAITSSNAVYSWGYGDMLALGNGEEKDENLPKKLNLKKSKVVGEMTVTQVAGGGQHSAIIAEIL